MQGMLIYICRTRSMRHTYWSGTNAAAWRKPCTRLPSSKSIHPIPNGEATNLPNEEHIVSHHSLLGSCLWRNSGKSRIFPMDFFMVFFSLKKYIFYTKHTYTVNTWVFKGKPGKAGGKTPGIPTSWSCQNEPLEVPWSVVWMGMVGAPEPSGAIWGREGFLVPSFFQLVLIEVNPFQMVFFFKFFSEVWGEVWL